MLTRVVASIVAFCAFLAFIVIVFGSWYTVDQGERAVLLRNGAIVATSEPGLHFKMPWIEDFVRISVQQQSLRWTCDKEGPCMQAYSQDQQPADLRVSVNWHIPEGEVASAYSTFGGLAGLQDRLIARKAPQEVKTVFGRFNAVTVIQERARFNKEVAAAVSAAIDGPVTIDSVQVENIDFSDAYEKSVEARMTAQVEVQKREQELAQKKIEAQITVTNAQAQADSQLAVAKANSEAIRIQGDAQASAIKARAAALADNPLLVQLTASERWNGVLPTTMLPGSTLPFISVTSH